MPSRSSTSSSRTLLGIPWPTRAFWLCAGAVLAVRLGLGAVAGTTDYFRGPTLWTDYLYNERVVLVERPSPRVLLMGSSRMLYGPHEDDFVELTDLAAEDVANVGIVGSTALESLWLLRRNPSALERLELAVFEINRLMLRRTNARAHQFRFLSLEERLRLDGKRDRVDAMVDWVLRNRADKRSAWQWLNGIADTARGRYLPSGHRIRELWWSEKDREGAAVGLSGPNVARDYLGGFRPAPSVLEYTDRLLDFFEERSIPVVMLVTPSSEAFRGAIPGVPGGPEVEPAWERWLAHLKERAPLIRFDTAASIGRGEDVFIDWAHMERAGSRALTEKLVGELRELELLPE